MRVIDAPDRGEHAQRMLSDADPMWNSMMRDTVAPTILQAGVRANVIPSEARAVVNLRLLPGDTAGVVGGGLRELGNDPGVALGIKPPDGLSAPECDTEFE